MEEDSKAVDAKWGKESAAKAERNLWFDQVMMTSYIVVREIRVGKRQPEKWEAVLDGLKYTYDTVWVGLVGYNALYGERDKSIMYWNAALKKCDKLIRKRDKLLAESEQVSTRSSQTAASTGQGSTASNEEINALQGKYEFLKRKMRLDGGTLEDQGLQIDQKEKECLEKVCPIGETVVGIAEGTASLDALGNLVTACVTRSVECRNLLREYDEVLCRLGEYRVQIADTVKAIDELRAKEIATSIAVAQQPLEHGEQGNESSQPKITTQDHLFTGKMRELLNINEEIIVSDALLARVAAKIKDLSQQIVRSHAQNVKPSNPQVIAAPALPSNGAGTVAEPSPALAPSSEDAPEDDKPLTESGAAASSQHQLDSSASPAAAAKSES